MFRYFIISFVVISFLPASVEARRSDNIHRVNRVYHPRKLSIKVYSDDIPNDPDKLMSGAHVFNQGDCIGRNQSPHIAWKMNDYSIVRSYAVTMYDPDSLTGSGLWHWIVYNVPSRVHCLPRGVSKFRSRELRDGNIGVTAVSDYGEFGFAGACPPLGSGIHRYVFTVHALNVEELPIKEGATHAMIRFTIMRHTIASNYIIAYYGRGA